MTKRHTTIASMLFATTIVAVAPLCAQQSAGTGERIGSAISAAIRTAFPAVNDVINVIWPNRSGKKTADEAERVLLPKKQASTEAVSRSLDPIRKVGQDLSLVGSFLEHAVIAHDEVIKMRKVVGEKISLNDSDKKDLGYSWNTARARLEALDPKKMESEINKVDDLYLRDKLKIISSVNYGFVANITSQLNGDVEQLRKSLDTLEEKLSGITAVAGYLITDLSAALNRMPSIVQLSGVGFGTGLETWLPPPDAKLPEYERLGPLRQTAGASAEELAAQRNKEMVFTNRLEKLFQGEESEARILVFKDHLESRY
ncbi:MAG: hypothetical protein HY648_09740 [Acidobacteria bacterium]|nr:hypothetical protein [Acidobacteriota bacterium]